MFRLIVFGFFIVFFGVFVRASDCCIDSSMRLVSSDPEKETGTGSTLQEGVRRVCGNGQLQSISAGSTFTEHIDRSVAQYNDSGTFLRYHYFTTTNNYECFVCTEPEINDPSPTNDSTHVWNAVYSVNTCGEETSTPAYTNTGDPASWYVQTQGACCQAKTYYKSCPVGQKPDDADPDICVIDPNSSGAPKTCPSGMHNVSTDPERLECVCDYGIPLYDPVTHVQSCQKPSCPASVNDLPLREQGITDPLCKSHAGNNDIFTVPYSFLSDSKTSLTCCYYAAEPSKCPKNEIYLDGRCIPISHNPDDNSTNPDHTCPTDQYWSINQNKCVPFYNPPDKNNSGGNGSSNGPGGSGNSDNNGTGGVSIGVSSKDSNLSIDVNVSLDLNETNDILRDINASLNRDFSGLGKDLDAGFSKMKDAAESAISSYKTNFGDLLVMVNTLKAPRVHFSGSCSLGFTAFGKHIDLSKGLKMFIPVLRPIIMLILNLYFAVLLIKLSIWAYHDVITRLSGVFR